MIEATMRIEVKLNKLSTAPAAVRTALGQIVKKTCFDIEAAAKDDAAVDTGAMKASIYSVVEGHDESAEVQAAAEALNPKIDFLPKPDAKVDELNGFTAVGADYAAYVEYGTSRMGAQPFFTPAVESVRPSFQKAALQLDRAIAASPGTTKL